MIPKFPITPFPDCRRSQKHCWSMAEQSVETGLLEMFIVCERFGDFQLTHNQEGAAVGQAPLLVGRLLIQRQCVLKLQTSLWDHSTIWIRAYRANQIHGSLP